MKTLDYVGDHEAIVYAQLGQQLLARTTKTSLEPRPVILFERAIFYTFFFPSKGIIFIESCFLLGQLNTQGRDCAARTSERIIRAE